MNGWNNSPGCGGCVLPRLFFAGNGGIRLKVLAIGNSFSQDATTFLHQVAEEQVEEPLLECIRKMVDEVMVK